MDYFIDYASCSVNKKGEELCGDHVERIHTKDGVIIVLSDGLGSGVKANILATLTSKIAITMLKEGASIEETIFTITNTLPECQVRRLAYSTFTIIQMKTNGEVYMVEYDNPPAFYYRGNKKHPLIKTQREVNGKLIYESHFTMRVGDTLTIVSDGAIHAGVGKTLNLGWQWEHIDDYLEDLVGTCHNADCVSRNLLEVCKNLYEGKPGDDTTVVTIRLEDVRYIDLFTGPPKSKEQDDAMMRHIKEAKGRIILCGGTTANIVARELGETIEIDLQHYTREVPPMGYMRGVDLVTEGLLTLNYTKQLLNKHLEEKIKGASPPKIKGEDGASRLAQMLIEEGTHIRCFIGQAINPAHQNPDFPENFNLKNTMMKDIANILEKLGKQVEVYYL